MNTLVRRKADDRIISLYACGVQIVCDNITGKRRSCQLEIAANAICREVIRLAMQTFDMLTAEDPDDYSLIQIDKLTKGIAGISIVCIK